MTLPYDYARCTGATHKNCQVCRRREPGRKQWQSYIMPAIEVDGRCSNFIEPIYLLARTKTLNTELGEPTKEEAGPLERVRFSED